ncbi:hypothetical protein, partial [Pedobacter sp.]|uniref:hypothetical protein n=1 Tax=Pedobacter sp. TaxID=1411316 RepID=UPI003D7FC80D
MHIYNKYLKHKKRLNYPYLTSSESSPEANPLLLAVTFTVEVFIPLLIPIGRGLARLLPHISQLRPCEKLQDTVFAAV